MDFKPSSTRIPPAAISSDQPLCPHPPHCTDGQNRSQDKNPLSFLQLGASRTDGLQPLSLHIASATPDPGDRAVPASEQNGADDGATPAGRPADDGDAEACARRAKAKLKKARAKLNKAEAAARQPKAVMFSFVEAIRKLEAEPGGDPAKRYLDRSAEGEFFLQDSPLQPTRAAAIFNQLFGAVTDELWFAHRHLPVGEQGSMNDEAVGLAEVLLFNHWKQGVAISLKHASRFAADISGATRFKTVEELRAHWMTLANADSQRLQILAKVKDKQDKMRMARVGRLCDLIPPAIGIAFANFECDFTDATPVRSRKDVVSALCQPMMCRTTDMSVLVGLLKTAHADATVSEHVLDFAARLGGTGATEEQIQALDTMSVALLVSLSPKALRKLKVTREELSWIQSHVFILAGHLRDCEMRPNQQRRDVTNQSLAPFSPSRLLELGRQYLNHQTGVEVVKTLLRATEILQANITEDEARIDRLVRIESRLGANFEGLDLDELLNVFVPQKVEGQRTIRSHEFKGLPHVDATRPQDTPPDDSAHVIEQAGQPDPQDTVEYWQGVWDGYREKNSQRQRGVTPAQVQGGAGDSDDEGDMKRTTSDAAKAAVAAASNSRSKQTGARARLAGYNHHLPSSDKHLPNAVSKKRMQEIVEAARQGRRYTQNHRDNAKSRAVRQAPEVD